VYKHRLIFRNETQPQIRPTVHSYTPPPTISPSYTQVRAALWDVASHRHTDSHDHYTFRLGYASHET